MGIAHEPWLEALLAVARHYRIDTSPERVRVDADWRARDARLDDVIERMTRQLGLVAVFDALDADALDPWRLPLIADFGDGRVGVIEQLDAQGNAGVRFSGEGGLSSVVDAQTLRQRVVRVLRARPQAAVADARVDEYIKPYRADWLWQVLTREWPRYVDVMLAALVANVLTLASTLFTMQVYDRVIPAQSQPTLWVLFSGLVIALGFAFLMRVLRTHISDRVGKRADLRISDRVFGHALRIRNDARPRSTGSFIAQLRELEQIRELITSSTIGAVSDLPFFVLFIGIMWLVGGYLVWVPLAALPLMVIPALLAQKSLARYSLEGSRESALRNAILVETVQNLDDIKLLRAEPRFQNQWNHINETSAAVGIKQRRLTSLLTNWTQQVQSLAYAAVVLVGAYPAMNGEISVGVVVGCSMLASRMMMPLGQMTGVLLRWQQAKVAREGLDQLMQKPVDQPDNSVRVHRPHLHGDYALSGVRFQYDEKATKPNLDIRALSIKAGERIALLGRNGAGKSTLLQLLAGLHMPKEGLLSLDGLKTSVLDPMDLRRDVALLNQQAALFYGSVRDNLTLGMPHASDEQLLRALDLSGAIGFVQALPEGLDYLVQEGGRGLSGGQKQLLLLARTLLREPNVLLLDEPTAWLDDASERQFIGKLEGWLGSRTLIVATHRPAALKWVDRVIVLDGGKVLRDGPKDDVLVKPALARPAARVAVGKVAREGEGA